MRRIVAGATGLIGQQLVEHWLAQKHDVTVIGRTLEHIQETFNTRVDALTWQQLTPEIFSDAEVVVNLAGTNVGDQRWTSARKKEILESRIQATTQLSHLLAQLGKASPPLFNASAISVYGLQTQDLNGLPRSLDERVVINYEDAPDFLTKVSRQWEMATREASENGVRIVFLRLGVVLAKEGGAFPKIVQPFRYFLGGPLGTGRQPFSWVEIEDVVRAIDFLASSSESSGPYNIVSPGTVSQQELADAIANAMNKPAVVPMPKFILKLMFGDEKAEELLLEGQHVYPRRLLEAGFQFRYPTIQSALQQLL